MADSTAPAKILTPPRPTVAAKPPSVPPAPASRPSAPKAPQAPKIATPVVAKEPEAPAPIALASEDIEEVAAPVIAAPVIAAPMIAAPAIAPPAAVPAALAPPAPRKSLLSVFTWDAFQPDPDPLAVAKMTPAVAMRRARFTRYVKGVVGGCAGLCLIALVRVAVASASETDDPAHVQAIVHKVASAKTLISSIEERSGHAPSFASKTLAGRHH